MKTKIVFAILFSLIFSITVKASSSVSDSNMKEVIIGNTNFAFNLYNKLRGDSNISSSGGNLFFSPYSVSTALSMTYGGARTETKEQIAKVLHFILPENELSAAFGSLHKQIANDEKSRGYQVFLANALWAQKGEPFLKEFLDLMHNYHDASINQLDFMNEPEPSRKIINSWVEEKTKYKIRDLVPLEGLDKDATLVLTNAIYFKGDWKTKFSWWKTQKTDFILTNNSKVKVSMMYLKENLKYVDDANIQAIELLYKGDDISMLVVLPKSLEDIKEAENILSEKNYFVLLSKMQSCEVEVYFPRFKITWGSFCLNNVFKTLGMPDAFEPGKADFSGITGNKNIWISDIFHKAFIEVDEKGTEAAAATSVAFSKAIHFEPPIFRADHPFIFIIKDNRSGSILFIGRLMNPAE